LLGGTVASGDHCFCYGKPVTPSSTLKLCFGPSAGGSSGIAIWNSNTGKVVFFRIIGVTLFYSRYQVTTGFSANTTSSANFINPWPHWGNWAVRFDGTSWFLETYMDVNCTQKIAQMFTEPLSTWIGTNYPHVGFAINSGTSVWGQHVSVIST
jgi:hypothetical protein